MSTNLSLDKLYQNVNFQNEVCRASISKQTKQHILKAFNEIKEITHGDNGNVMKKHKIVCGGYFFGKL
jgi:DNA topoisomerase IA